MTRLARGQKKKGCTDLSVRQRNRVRPKAAPWEGPRRRVKARGRELRAGNERGKREAADCNRAYRKSLMKASKEFSAAGDRARPMREKWPPGARLCAATCPHPHKTRLSPLARPPALGIADGRDEERLLGALVTDPSVDVDLPVARQAFEALLRRSQP